MALEKPNQNSWLYKLCGQLLLKSLDAFSLFTPASVTSKASVSPKYVRAVSYEYSFSSRDAPENWWVSNKTTLVEHVATLSLKDDHVREALVHLGCNFTVDRTVAVSCNSSLVCVDQRVPVVAGLALAAFVPWLIKMAHFPKPKTRKTIDPKELTSPAPALGDPSPKQVSKAVAAGLPQPVKSE